MSYLGVYGAVPIVRLCAEMRNVSRDVRTSSSVRLDTCSLPTVPVHCTDQYVFNLSMFSVLAYLSSMLSDNYSSVL